MHDDEPREIDAGGGEGRRIGATRRGDPHHAASLGLQLRERRQREAQLADAFAFEQDFGERSARRSAARQHGVERSEARGNAGRLGRAVPAAPDGGMGEDARERRIHRRGRHSSAADSGGSGICRHRRLQCQPAACGQFRSNTGATSGCASMRSSVACSAGRCVSRCLRVPDHSRPRRQAGRVRRAAFRKAMAVREDVGKHFPVAVQACPCPGANALLQRLVYLSVLAPALGKIDDADRRIAIGGNEHQAAQHLRAHLRIGGQQVAVRVDEAQVHRIAALSDIALPSSCTSVGICPAGCASAIRDRHRSAPRMRFPRSGTARE